MRGFKAIGRHRWNKRCERTVKTVEMSGKCVAIDVIGKPPQGCKVKLEGRHHIRLNCVVRRSFRQRRQSYFHTTGLLLPTRSGICGYGSMHRVAGGRNNFRIHSHLAQCSYHRRLTCNRQTEVVDINISDLPTQWLVVGVAFHRYLNPFDFF